MKFFFFFFQAEDGIRDHCVTGVQTCALPISKEVLARYGVAVPKNGGVATTVQEVRAAVEALGGRGVLKAQVHSGGRGKAGGIKVANSPEEAERQAGQMLGMLLKTHQVPQGLTVEKLLIEE